MTNNVLNTSNNNAIKHTTTTSQSYFTQYIVTGTVPRVRHGNKYILISASKCIVMIIVSNIFLMFDFYLKIFIFQR
ncbi:hypothetical protein A0H76_2918 [Hepatospora eriocheir]|uniref:Uncharacterized protein n=1 Tax=Hepatospora eriocheir TaxID=1081669 RepID=A0A1X0Q5I1_9MICR|nr:hypothetical protein A0H76_2918 [Hepatospora eriocheir]